MKTIYVVAIRIDDKNSMYQFDSGKDRAGFITDLNAKFPGEFEWATTEMEVDSES